MDADSPLKDRLEELGATFDPEFDDQANPWNIVNVPKDGDDFDQFLHVAEDVCYPVTQVYAFGDQDFTDRLNRSIQQGYVPPDLKGYKYSLQYFQAGITTLILWGGQKVQPPTPG